MAPHLRPGIVGILALGAAVPAAAQRPLPPIPTTEQAELHRAAYSALARTDGLSGLNIGVRVLDGGTAVLWGNARPTDVALAAAVLKEVPGVVRVVNTCDPVPAADPLIARVRAAFQPPPEPAAEGTNRPLPPILPVGERSTSKKPFEAPAQPVARLLDPMPAAGPVDYARIEHVRRSDPRFARLRLDLRNGRVVILGAATDPRAAWDLARQIAPLVGDREVVVATPR